MRLAKNKQKCILFWRYLISKVLPVAEKFKDQLKIVGSSENLTFKAFTKKTGIHIFSFFNFYLIVNIILRYSAFFINFNGCDSEKNFRPFRTASVLEFDVIDVKKRK